MAVLAAILTFLIVAQSGEPRLTFEVAAVKKNTSGEVDGRLALTPGGYFRAINFDVFNLVAFAFRTTPRNLFRSQIVGAPDWTHTERYDVDGKMSRELFDRTAADRFRAPKLVKSLLEDRFRMQAHREQRELPVYDLVVTSGKLAPVDVDCDTDRGRCSFKYLPGHLTARAVAMDTLAAMLSSEVQRLVVDHTGLAARYDIELEWAEEAASSDKPSIFTALQEQLGLKLESVREPVDVVVVDHIEKPAED